MQHLVIPLHRRRFDSGLDLSAIRLANGDELSASEAWARATYHQDEFVVESRDGTLLPITFDSVLVTVVRMACHGLPA